MALLESVLFFRKSALRNDPPGPGRINSLRSIFGLRNDRIGPIVRLHKQYPDIALCRVGRQRLYFLNKPELIQECLLTRHKSMHKDPYYFFLKLILGNGLLTSEEDLHLKQRRMIQPAFHKERIPAYGRVMLEEADALASRIVVIDRGPARPDSTVTSAGFGIVGMTGRAQAVGGELSAGPGASGGFEVRASLPLPEIWRKPS